MKTIIKYAHGKGFSKNLSSVTVIASPRTNEKIQENMLKAHPQKNISRQTLGNILDRQNKSRNNNALLTS